MIEMVAMGGLGVVVVWRWLGGLGVMGRPPVGGSLGGGGEMVRGMMSLLVSVMRLVMMMGGRWRLLLLLLRLLGGDVVGLMVEGVGWVGWMVVRLLEGRGGRRG